MANNGPTFAKLGPGNLPHPEDPQNAPDEGLFGDLNEVEEWLLDNHGDDIQSEAIDILTGFICSTYRDRFDEAKLGRLFLAMADKYYEMVKTEDESRRQPPDDLGAYDEDYPS